MTSKRLKEYWWNLNLAVGNCAYKLINVIVCSYLEVHMWIANSVKQKSFNLKVVLRPSRTYECVNFIVGKKRYCSGNSAKELCCGACPKNNFSRLAYYSSIDLASEFEVLVSCVRLLNSFQKTLNSQAKQFSSAFLEQRSRPHQAKIEIICLCNMLVHVQAYTVEPRLTDTPQQRTPTI